MTAAQASNNWSTPSAKLRRFHESSGPWAASTGPRWTLLLALHSFIRGASSHSHWDHGRCGGLRGSRAMHGTKQFTNYTKLRYVHRVLETPFMMTTYTYRADTSRSPSVVRSNVSVAASSTINPGVSFCTTVRQQPSMDEATVSGRSDVPDTCTMGPDVSTKPVNMGRHEPGHTLTRKGDGRQHGTNRRVRSTGCAASSSQRRHGPP